MTQENRTALPLREYRVRRVFNGKSGIVGTDYVELTAATNDTEARSFADVHRSVADEVHIEFREISPWRPLLLVGKWPRSGDATVALHE